MKTWDGYNAALASDPAGVLAVLLAGDAVGAPRRGLAWAIERESGWKPDAINPYPPHANGLMQWDPTLHPYAANAHTLTRAQQAPFVTRYLAPYRGHFSTRDSDVYLAIAYPEALLKGWPDEHVISSPGGAVWTANRSWRSPGDGPVTVGAIRDYGGTPPETGGPADVVPGTATPPAPVLASTVDDDFAVLATMLAAFGAALAALRARLNRG